MKCKILLFSLLFCLVFSSMAFADIVVPETLPDKVYPLPEISEDYTYSEHFIFFDSNLNYRIVYFYFDEPFNIDSYYNGTDAIYYVADKNVHREEYIYDSITGTSWIESSKNTLTANNRTWSFFRQKIYSSTFNIRMSETSDELFFQAPPTELYQMIHKVTEEGLATEMNLAGTMKILVLCGVGLVALLMGLNLFGKVFNRFRA